MATVVISLGERLSPSQVKTFLGCSARWYFKYFVGLPEPKTGSLALGTAVHQALGKNFQQKIASREDLPVEEVEQAFGEAFNEAAEVTEFREDEDPVELKAVGARLTEKYMKECAPSVQPRMVEAEVSGKLGGVSVKGIVGRLAVGTCRDLKKRMATTCIFTLLLQRLIYRIFSCKQHRSMA